MNSRFNVSLMEIPETAVFHQFFAFSLKNKQRLFAGMRHEDARRCMMRMGNEVLKRSQDVVLIFIEKMRKSTAFHRFLTHLC